MNNEELIMNNEKSHEKINKTNATPVGARLEGIPVRHDTTVPKKSNKTKATPVGAAWYATQKIKTTHGITLIALIITIIVMLILAGVVLSLTIGERGIFKTAQNAGKNYTNASKQELAGLNKLDNDINDILTGIGQTGGNADTGKTDGSFSTKNKVNTPKLNGTGLTPITINADGTTVTANTQNDNWYSYDGTTNKWANAVTKNTNGEITGYFVWIPRYAYKITYTNINNKSAGGTIDVVFLQGTTNLDFNGKDVTASAYVDEKGNTGAYIVHPAFQDESNTGYQNGGWDAPLTGFWVAKFEAGYEGIAGDKTSATDSNASLSVLMQWNGSMSTDLTTNYYGTREIGDKIKYPVFKANRPSMNNLGISDAYDLCLDIKNGTSVYGLSNVDSHMMKNSEWGAVAYLTHSKYGRNAQEVTLNNVSANNENTIYAVTGYGGTSIDASEDTTRTLATLLTDNQEGSWTTTQGQTASTTGNIYGIYDLSGGTWEWTAGYVATTGIYETYGGSLKGDSTKYKTKYAGTSNTDKTNYNSSSNWERVGEAIWETSSQGSGANSWNDDGSYFWYTTYPFSTRGGGWDSVSSAGVFAFLRNYYCNYGVGFRSVLVAE